MPFRLTREQLYDLVWSEAMIQLGRKIGISDVGLAKCCRSIDVPIPARGYWNKLQAGKKLPRTPLPPRDLGTINSIEMKGTLSAELRSRIRDEPGPREEQFESIESLMERFRKRLGAVKVPRSFSNAHPKIAALLAKDEVHRQKALTERFYFSKPQFESPFERRRIRVLNAIILAFSRVGGSVHIRGINARELTILIGHAGIDFNS